MDRTKGNKKPCDLASDTLNQSTQKTLLDMPTEILAIILSHTTKSRFAACQACRILSSIIHDIIGYHSIRIKTEEQVKQVVKHCGIMKHTRIYFGKNWVFQFFPSDKIVEQFAGVHTIDLSRVSVTDEGVKALVGVHTLDLSHCEITDEGVIPLAGVHTINLSFTSVTDKALQSLVGVHTINLYECSKITVEGIKALKGVHEISLSFPRDSWLKQLGDVHTVCVCKGFSITDDGIKSLTNVKYLDLHGSPKITDLGFKTLVNIERLALENCPQITNGCLKHLPSLKQVAGLKTTKLTIEAVESMGIQYCRYI